MLRGPAPSDVVRWPRSNCCRSFIAAAISSTVPARFSAACRSLCLQTRHHRNFSKHLSGPASDGESRRHAECSAFALGRLGAAAAAQ